VAGRKVNLTPEQLTPNQKVRFGWSARTPPDLDGQPLFQSRADGWDWFAPLGEGRCAWVKLRHNEQLAELITRGAFFDIAQGRDIFCLATQPAVLTHPPPTVFCAL